MVEVVGNIGATEPEHIEDGIVNVGVVVVELTVIINVVVVAHCPAVGVKV